MARRALTLQRGRRGLARVHIRGIRGAPAIHSTPEFGDTWGHTSDSLHVVAEGILVRMVQPMLNGHGQGHTFRAGVGETLEPQLALQATLRRVSELDHVKWPLDDIGKWKALDYFNFALGQIGLLCCDDQVIRNTRWSEMLVNFADTLYLLHDGRPSQEKRDRMGQSMERFVKLYREELGDWHCVVKFHVFQHLLEVYDRHGPAFLWDSYGFERLLGRIKRDVTTTRHYLLQAGRNFALRYVSESFFRIRTYSLRVRQYIRKVGISTNDASLADLTVAPMSVAPETTAIPDDHHAHFRRVLADKLGVPEADYEGLDKRRLLRIRWLVRLFFSALLRELGLHLLSAIPCCQVPRDHHVEPL